MNNIKIAIIGLGYVGLPLACLFATKYEVIGFDIDEKKIKDLNAGIDTTLEVGSEKLEGVLKKQPEQIRGLYCTSEKNDIKGANYFIVTVPTPVDGANRPDISNLLSATEILGSILEKRAIVIFESTVYPGVTEEICVPLLEKSSNLSYNLDFFVGYSPERINPGDKTHTVEKIMKVTSGSTVDTAKKIDNLYKSVITAGTYLAPSILVAEAAKVIENSQRDINIAFVNELSKIFALKGIDTNEVLKTAATKWNFLPFKPGLVGGHCIGVDPYYLAQMAQENNYIPEIILAGRRMNDSMGKYVASEVIRVMIHKDIAIKEAKILVLGITFKENCKDVRNTKVVDLINQLIDYGTEVNIYDPWADYDEVYNQYGLSIKNRFPDDMFDAIVLAVAHKEFLTVDFRKSLNSNGIIYDVKSVLPYKVDGRL